ncbi:MAG TPA: cytochrome c [Campylobacterales bacterium]|nr:cytochrome c [Campylobacterales bacterium]
MRRVLIGCIALFGAVALSGCGGDKKVEERLAQIQTNTPTVTETNTTAAEAPKAATAAPVDGKGIYAGKCVACHGQNGEGKGAYPKLAGNSKDDALKKLNGYVDGTYGKAQKMMMAGQAKALSDAERAAVAEYIATLK